MGKKVIHNNKEGESSGNGGPPWFYQEKRSCK